MHRFFISREAFSGNGVTMLGEQAHQIRNVLRMRPGHRIVVLDNDGWEYEIELERVDREAVCGAIVEKRSAENEPEIRLTLYQSVMKRDRFEWILQKCTEVGVTQFVPVFTSRSIGQGAKTISPGKQERWQRIIAEAAEQSRRGRIPLLVPAMTFTEAVDSLDDGQLALLPWEQAGDNGLKDALPGRKPDSLSLFIGPEGGFSEEEVAYARERGIIPVSLGRRILRAETAAVVATAMVLYELGEMT